MSDAITAMDNIYHTRYHPPVQEVPVTDNLSPIEKPPLPEELPPVEENYPEEPETDEVDNKETETGQNVDTFA